MCTLQQIISQGPIGLYWEFRPFKKMKHLLSTLKMTTYSKAEIIKALDEFKSRKKH